EVPGFFAGLLRRRPGGLALRARHLGHVIGVVGPRAVDGAGIENGGEQSRAAERDTLRAGFAGLEPLRGLIQKPAGARPVLEYSEHARMGPDPGDRRGVVHRVAEQHASTRAWTGPKAQELVGHRDILLERELAEGPTIP